MAPTRTFVDADVLIWAARGKESLSQAALTVLASPDREFVVSDFLRLEVLPKAAYHKQQGEEAFYRRVLAAAVETIPASPALVALAEQLAISYGLSAIDGLHVAAAITASAAEFLTAERTTSPLFRVQEIRMTSIRPMPRPTS